MTTATADDVYRDVMTVAPPTLTDPAERARHDHLFGTVWARPGLGRRERRWVALVAVGFDTDQTAMADHIYAGLNSGDITLPEMLEFVLQFAVYCGWPKASQLERIVREQWQRMCRERGEEPTPWPDLDNATLGETDWERRLRRGEQEFRDVNLVPAPTRDSPYQQAGILNYVFGHVWQRPGLKRRDRRFITVAAVGVVETPIPILSHVGSALHSGDITHSEMTELIALFAAYAGRHKADQLTKAVRDDALGTMLAGD